MSSAPHCGALDGKSGHEMTLPSLRNRLPVEGRRNAIVAAVKASEYGMTVGQLATRLEVSEVTIRRDLDKLHGSRQLIRVRGGALPTARSTL